MYSTFLATETLVSAVHFDNYTRRIHYTRNKTTLFTILSALIHNTQSIPTTSQAKMYYSNRYICHKIHTFHGLWQYWEHRRTVKALPCNRTTLCEARHECITRHAILICSPPHVTPSAASVRHCTTSLGSGCLLSGDAGLVFNCTRVLIYSVFLCMSWSC